jgi:hypothetical protein
LQPTLTHAARNLIEVMNCVFLEAINYSDVGPRRGVTEDIVTENRDRLHHAKKSDGGAGGLSQVESRFQDRFGMLRAVQWYENLSQWDFPIQV